MMLFVIIFVTAENETFRTQIICYLYLLIFVFYTYQADACFKIGFSLGLK